MKTLLLIIAINLCSFQMMHSQKLDKTVVSKVSLKKVGDSYSFYIDQEAFEIKGVGINYTDGHDFKTLKQIGGNSFRTWSTTHAEEELEQAKQHGFMVAMGIDLKKELHGFDYSDSLAVNRQFEKVKNQIQQYKNHPNLLCWVVGNELNLLFGKEGQLKLVNPKAYEALAEIVAYIHEVDPNHPVTTTFAGANKEHLEMALKHCPDLDFLSIQVYGALEHVEKIMKDTGIHMPYLISEFGPTGFWEMPTTSWGREIEEASGPKAEGIAKRYQKGILENASGLCLGGFAFEWGQKQERTPTWFGMFYEDGSQTQTIDELEKLWNGNYPKNRAPNVRGITLNGKIATNNISIPSNKKMLGIVEVDQADKGDLSYTWLLFKEVINKSLGGAFEKRPDAIILAEGKTAKAKVEFTSPLIKGEYRILVYVHNKEGKAGSANIPFLVN